MDAFESWLQRLGLGRYASVFAAHEVDLDALRLLTEEDLEELGLPLGPRRKLLHALKLLNNEDAPPAAASATASLVAATAGASSVTELPAANEVGERRQLTVLFCDMVGFTELASRLDPEVLQRIIRSYEDACAVCVTRYEGYVFQRLGDGIVAFFGYPLAHEGEAERAIRAGLDIIESLARSPVPDAGHLQVRIGIATGLVVVSSAEKGAVGETMNLASRLQAVARPDALVVSERVRRLAGGAFDYDDLGQVVLKGIPRPTRAYRVRGVSAAASRFEAATQHGLTPLVGREQEIALLLERWRLTRDGEGHVVLLCGEPGIGKSRILNALRERLEEQGASILRFQCSPYYVNTAFWPLIDNFERALGSHRGEGPEPRLDKLEALVVTRYGRPLSDVRFLASMLSIPTDQRYGPLAMTPQKYKQETLRALVDLTEAIAQCGPTVMLFEDAHWADPTTLAVLDLIIDRMRTVALLMVLTHRPEFVSGWSEHGHVTGLNLAKLTRAQSNALVSDLTGGKALPAELLEQVLARTDGVPLYVEELTKAILESGELQDVGDHYAYVGVAPALPIPPTLRDSLMARLDRLMPVKEIAQIGAAIGREFSYELIAAVAPRSQAELDDGLTRLTESGLAFRRGIPPEATYIFKHALVQDAAYDSLLKSRRQDLHVRIAQAIEARFAATKETEPELVAHHYTEADQPNDAVPYWLKAGLRALHRSALKESVDHLGRGLHLLLSLPDTPEREARELEFQALLGTAQMMWKGYANPATGAAYQRADALGYPDQAARADEERAAQARRLGHPFLVAFGDMWGGSVWHYRVDEGRHREILRAVEALSREQGFPMWEAGSIQYQGWWLVQRGDLERGIEMLDRAHHGWRATGAGNVGPYQRALLADAHSRAGHDVEARQWIDGALAWVEQVDERCHEAEVHRLRGDILLRGAGRDEERAEAAYLASLRIARHQHARGWELRTATSLAHLWRSQGNSAEARDLLAPIYGWFTEGFETHDLQEARALLDELRF